MSWIEIYLIGIGVYLLLGLVNGWLGRRSYEIRRGPRRHETDEPCAACWGLKRYWRQVKTWERSMLWPYYTWMYLRHCAFRSCGPPPRKRKGRRGG